MSNPETHRIRFNGEPAREKRHGGNRRRWRLKSLDRVVRALGVTALRPPPRRRGETASKLEARRLAELTALGVYVPQVFEHGPGRLVLCDIGQTLAHRIRIADAKPAGALARARALVQDRRRSNLKRLGFLAGLTYLRGSRAAGLGKTVRSLQRASAPLVSGLSLIGLGVNYLHDGDLEVIQWVSTWIG